MKMYNMMRNKFLSILGFCLFHSCSIASQEVYQHVTTTNIYDYLDELANNKIIEINSVIKPYSRNYIAGKLREAIKSY